MDLSGRPPEQSVWVAFLRAMLLIAAVTLLGWLFAEPEVESAPAPAATRDAPTP
ncbi:MAG: hypothetical protein JNK82_19395 [Myxococcaceae bacterium]|nr:hypothetical protein [Myxococcaceae bacterium]